MVSAKASPREITAVDRNVQENARRVKWSGKGNGQVALAVSDRKDLTHYVQENFAKVSIIKGAVKGVACPK